MNRANNHPSRVVALGILGSRIITGPDQSYERAPAADEEPMACNLKTQAV